MSLGLETSQDPIFKVLVLVSVLMPRVSVLVMVLKVLGLGLETSLWMLNDCSFFLILKAVLMDYFGFVSIPQSASPGFRSMVKNCTKFPVPNNGPAV